jgi:hypothetical protein
MPSLTTQNEVDEAVQVPLLVSAKPGAHVQLPAEQVPAKADISGSALQVWFIQTVQLVVGRVARQRPVRGLTSKRSPRLRSPQPGGPQRPLDALPVFRFVCLLLQSGGPTKP